MDDSQCTMGGHRLCLVICILAFIIPAHTHGAAAAGATTLSIEGIQDLRTTVDELKAFSKAEKKVNDGIHHSLAVNTDKISGLEKTLQALKDKVNQLEQKQTADESRIALKAENAHFVAIFNETQVNPGPIKFMPSYITTFGSKDGEQRELSANCGSCKWKQDTSTGRIYYIPPEEDLTWWDASKRCQMEGGQLLSIGSPEEQNFINGMVEDGFRFFPFWTGGQRIQGQVPSSSDGTGWEWSDGSPFNFTNWSPGDPDNEGGVADCIIFWTWTGQWLDYNCSSYWRPFCEKPAGKIFTDGVFKAPISGVYELRFTAWTTVNRSIVLIRNNNRIIASASSNSVGKFGTYIIEELKVRDKVAVFLSQGAIGGQSAKFFGKFIEHSWKNWT